MTDPKTISDLPPDVSIRWAKDQEALREAPPIIQDAMTAASHAQTDAFLPLGQSAIDALCGLTKFYPSWASFQMPPHFLQNRRRLFKFNLAPFLESDDNLEELIERVKNINGNDYEKDQILRFFQHLQHLKEDFIRILALFKQYQKG